MIAEFLHLKPVISVNTDGEYFTYCKAKGRRKSIEKLVEIVQNAVREREINLAVLHGRAAGIRNAAETFQTVPQYP